MTALKSGKASSPYLSMIGLSLLYVLPIIAFSLLYYGNYTLGQGLGVSTILIISGVLILRFSEKRYPLGFKEKRDLSQKIIFALAIVCILAGIGAILACLLPHKIDIKPWIIRASTFFGLALGFFLTLKEWKALNPRDRFVYFLTVAVAPPTILSFLL